MMPEKQRDCSDHTPRNPENEIEIAGRRARRACFVGYRYVGGPLQRLAQFLKSEIAKWAQVAKSASLK